MAIDHLSPIDNDATSLPSANGHSLVQQQDMAARQYIESLVVGTKPVVMPDVGRWQPTCTTLAREFDRESASIVGVLKALIQSKKVAGLKELLYPVAPVSLSSSSLFSPSIALAEQEPIDIPSLPPHVQAYTAHAHKASPLLDKLIAFLKYWCTRSYDGYHEGVALWVLATVAARRVHLHWRKGIWTPLYIMLVSESTTHAKTDAAGYGRKIVEDAGLSFLLTPDEITPQKLLHNMCGLSVPRNYSMKDVNGKEFVRLQKAFSGQQGWVYDEFGNKLQEIIAAKGYANLLYALLKQLYDCKTTHQYDTMRGDNEIIDMPYLSIIGTATPACLKPISGTKSATWTDGTFARLSFIVPPLSDLKLQSAPNEACFVPSDILSELVAWHHRLGIPDCQIIDTQEQEEQLAEAHGEDNSKKKKKEQQQRPPYEVQKDKLPQQTLYMTNEVYVAQDEYYKVLVTLAHEQHLDERFKSTYGRLPEKALRIAMLLASLEGCTHVHMRHFGRGMQITEHWRRDFHELIAQVSTDHVNTRSYGEVEQQIIDVLVRQPSGTRMNAWKISQQTVALRKVGSPEIRKMIEELIAAAPDLGIIKEGQGKSALYGLKTGEE